MAKLRCIQTQEGSKWEVTYSDGKIKTHRQEWQALVWYQLALAEEAETGSSDATLADK